MLAGLILALFSANEADRAEEVIAPHVVVSDTTWFSARQSNVSMAVPSKAGEFLAKDWKTIDAKKPDDVLLPCTPCEVTQ